MTGRPSTRAYRRAATTAAPHALQVADRWHLLVNVRELAERWLMSVYPRLRQLPPLPDAAAHGLTPSHEAPSGAPTTAASPVRRDRAFPTTAAERQRSVASAARWRAVYDEVRRRHGQARPAVGEPIVRISRT